MRWPILPLGFWCLLQCVVCLDSEGITSGISPTTASTDISSPSSATQAASAANTTTTSAPEAALNTTAPRVVVPTLPYDDDDVDENKGRSLNFTVPDATNTVENRTMSLDDLSLDDIPMLTTNTTTSTTPAVLTRPDDCVEADGRRYAVGETFSRGCDENCRCVAGRAVCEPRCERPFVRRGATPKDALCHERVVDDCCAQLICSQDTEAEPLEGCIHKNQTFHHGEMFNDGCEAVCSCGDAGAIQCKPRCPQQMHNSTSDQCVPVPDPADPCCTVVFCDVTLGDHDLNKISTEEPSDSQIRLKSADALNSTTAIIHFLGEPELDSNLTAEVSTDQSTWRRADLDGVIVHGLEVGATYYIRVVSGGVTSNAVVITLPKETPSAMDQLESGSPSSAHVPMTNLTAADKVFSNGTCIFRGQNYTLGQEFNMGCEAFCICTDEGVDCSPIECPTEYGLDLLDPACVQWETKPRNFTPTPPHCCPDHARCINNGSCQYMGHSFDNWAEIPTTLSGCEKKCYCELGNVTCQSMCPPVPATPPKDLPCTAQEAMLHHLLDDDCCLYWVCPHSSDFGGHQLPPAFANGPHRPNTDGVLVQLLEPIDEHTVRLAFSVPPVLVGLHGRVEVRYTSTKQEEDPSTWDMQVLAPPGDLIATPQLHFDLGNLLADTTYYIIIKIILRDLSNTPQSPVLSVRTHSSSGTTLPPQIPIEPALVAAVVNATWVQLTWRKFTDFEMQFIDGLQLRYREQDGKVFSATPLLHRSVTSYTVEDLKPNVQYEVGLFFIPFPGQATELQSERNIEVTTTLENDPFKFDIHLEIVAVKSTTVEVTWAGVPYPEDKYVNIYRVIYQSETGKEDFNSFKVAKRDSTPKITITDLKPITRYRLWLEAYMTNGRIKKSNVQDFVSKSGGTVSAGHAHPGLNEIEEGKLSGHRPGTMEPGDYYGPLVAVAILAALAIMAALILLLVLMRKNGQNKAAITSSRKTQSAYDNPSYKVEIQQETMDL